MKNNPALSLASLTLAFGIALGGWFIGDGFLEGRTDARYVTVKGVSERDVKADLAIWPMRYVASGDRLADVQAKIQADTQRILAFLAAAGIAQEHIELQNLEVVDRQAQMYNSGPYETRFVVAQTLLARSADVDKIAAASQEIGRLVEAGVILDSQSGPFGGGPLYLFNRLTQLKPEMIAEATKNARAAAQQFALDAGSALGGIRRADQGVFVILARDKTPGLMEEKQIHKTVRVVSTLDYFLAE